MSAAPGPRPRPVLGNLPEFRAFGADSLGFLAELMRQYPRFARLRFAHVQVFALFHPELLDHGLRGAARRYDKQTAGYRVLSLLGGRGLLTSDGELWRRQRVLATEPFRPQALEGYATGMTRVLADVVEGWRARPDPAAPLDFFEEMTRVTLRIAGLTLFSRDLTGEAHEVGEALSYLFGFLNRRIFSLLPLPLWMPTPANRRYHRSLATVHALVDSMIRERRAGGGPDDLMGRLMAAVDPETGQGMSDRQLRDEVVTMLGAGHETTATSLAWTGYLLARHPEAQARARDEVARVLGGRPPGWADLPALGWTRACFREALRLYPPLWTFSRRCVEADEIEGVPVPVGSELLLAPWATHRHPEFWPEPERFDPERFLGGRHELRHPFAWIPFGAGPRRCIGIDFAHTEGVLLLASLLQRFRLQLPGGTVVLPETTITLRPRGGLRLGLVPAEAA